MGLVNEWIFRELGSGCRRSATFEMVKIFATVFSDEKMLTMVTRCSILDVAGVLDLPI